MTDLLDRVLGEDPPAFALLYRPETGDAGVVDVLLGTVSTPDSLAAVPVPDDGGPGHRVLTMIPYRQLAERDFACVDDGAPLLAMAVTAQASVPLHHALERLPDRPTRLTGGRFTTSDEEYAETVRRVIADEIGTGAGANFVIRRDYVAQLDGCPLTGALSAFRRLLERESGAYWTFLVHTGEHTFVGATPERHVNVTGGVATMNPISGTYRYPRGGPTLPDVMAFLGDRKETDELLMVVDEELKMMARICPDGGRVVGPFLKEMARLAHTEYLIEGHTDRDPREILRETMFAPTVTGSPLENACRVIRRYEPDGRGYYSGVVALIGRDEAGGSALDSAILIRAADIDAAGRVRIGVGATLVRHSDPVAEVAETQAKASGLIAALAEGGRPRFGDHPRVRAALERRNDTLADYWLADRGGRVRPEPALVDRRALVVDAEDTFTAMLDQQLRSLGLEVTVCGSHELPDDVTAFDLVVLGPGPGDPTDDADPRVVRLGALVRRLLAERRPFVAICLSHQVLCRTLGLPLRRRDVPNQGVQREIDLFGTAERVGFYNTFSAHCDRAVLHRDDTGAIEVSRDPRTGEVHSLRGDTFASIQFHAESVLTLDGVRILGELLSHTVRGRAIH